MIEKLDIESFGIYQDFRWRQNPELNNTTFKKLNIIYGRNYSGKTTLSRIFRSIEEKKYPSFIKNPKFNIYLTNNIVKNQDEIFEANLNILVYNDDFIKDNLGFFYDDTKNIKSFKVKIGKENQEILKEIENCKNVFEKIEKLISKIEKEYNSSFKLYENEKSNLTKSLQDKANKYIKHQLYGIATYNITSIKNDIEYIIEREGTKFTFLDESIQKKYEKIIKEDKKNKIYFHIPNEYKKLGTLIEKVKNVLSKEIKPSKIIQELLNNYELEQWVKQGINLHKNKSKICAFCGNTIEDLRYDELDRHFDKAHEEFENQIEELKKEIESINIHLNLKEEQFYELYKENLKEFFKQFSKLNNEFEIVKNNLIKLLDKKLKNKTKSLSVDYKIIENYSSLVKKFDNFFEKLENLIEKNNSYTNNLLEEQHKSKLELRLNEIKKFLSDINYFDTKEKIRKYEHKKQFWQLRLSKITECKNRILDKINELEDSLNDEKASIELINKFLNLTTSHLKLSINEKNEKQVFYEILRENKKSKKLSNGEQSLIAFCYFLAKAKNKLDNENNVIIYIDDPVSSLDNNHIFSIYALIEKHITKEKKYLQCYISTHNLDFLRYLKSITIPKTSDNKDDIEYFLIERIKKQNISNSTIKLLPKYIKNYTTELHFTFEKIYKLYNENKRRSIETVKGRINNTYNEFYDIPNALRKFLEYYMFYKFPDNDGLTIEKLNFFGTNGEAEKINRVVNEFSHLTYIERAWKPLDIEEIIEIINIIIETIQNEDKEYFECLLKVVD
ncbi:MULTISPECIES: AAA family ATPase [unclassified Nitratiruptor]|uniref:AAA family ATPase n=1 Tax=unclassified Nitratiruptor TaxID=2624044 RepID=UPI00191501EE|nr:MULTISPECIES: AAA family ATPase [unclassified Nitratiruptor]BCD59339.1 hypothetical protein NitYY0810_C0069 [Nitratiruptor sp. YY08-10]BCD63263.1 hypothetical protein NitYY0814_C0069 [Nitratiruptor sp. YY08-14]